MSRNKDIVDVFVWCLMQITFSNLSLHKYFVEIMLVLSTIESELFKDPAELNSPLRDVKHS